MVVFHIRLEVFLFYFLGWDKMLLFYSYRFNEDTGKFQKYQEFDVFAAQIVRHFVIGSYDYLAIATFDQKVVILKVSVLFLCMKCSSAKFPLHK